MDGEAAQHKERAHMGTFSVSVCRGRLGRKPNTKNMSSWTHFSCCRAVEVSPTHRMCPNCVGLQGKHGGEGVQLDTEMRPHMDAFPFLAGGRGLVGPPI